MRSLRSFLDRGDAAQAVPEGRPETLRRATLATNAKFILAGSGLAAAPALYLLITQGLLLPTILAVLGVAIGCVTLALHRRGQFDDAASGQVYGILATGLILTAADPALGDFGLAIAVLAPVYASLMTGSAMKKRAWLLLAVVVAFAALGAYGVALWPEPFHPRYGIASGLGFALTALMVAHSANRLNSVFEVYEKAQVNAFRHLIEHVQDAVMRFSADGSVLFTSQSSEALFGCRRYELTGNGLIERIHVLDRPIYMTAFADANHGAKCRTVEVRVRRDSEQGVAPTFFWVEVALTPVIDADDGAGPHEIVALFRDVTERKDQQSEMREAQRVAEAASDAKSRFLATIGHELRTPLNAIVGFSEMMTSGVVGELAPAHKEYAELIHKSGLHLIDVVRMLLDMSRIEAGKFELQTDSFEPEGLVEPCLQMVDVIAREREIRVTTNLARNLPKLIADERACRQILINLVSNAIKFSHQGGPVAVSMKRQGRFLNLSVADRGIGMTPEALKRIGEPFFQAQEGLSRGYEGTGLGLSIVKGLVDLHQGELHVTSTPGEGTTITVLLPLNGPVVKSVESGAVTKLHPGPHGTFEEEETYDGKHSVASAAAGR
jgi:cell cycle sensor histidine kinase DivJ